MKRRLLYESDATALRNEVKNNLKISLNKIKSMIYMSNIELFGTPELSVIDWELHTTEGLTMVLVEIKFFTQLDSPMLVDLVETLKIVENKLNETLVRVKFDKKGNLKSAKDDSKGLVHGGIMIDELNFDNREESMDLTLASMFNPN